MKSIGYKHFMIFATTMILYTGGSGQELYKRGQVIIRMDQNFKELSPWVDANSIAMTGLAST